jgi:hypothetical protein
VVIPALPRDCLCVLECRQLFHLRSGELRVEDKGLSFGIDSLGTSYFLGKQVLLAVRTTARLDRIIMKIFSEGRGGVLLELGCLQAYS